MSRIYKQHKTSIEDRRAYIQLRFSFRKKWAYAPPVVRS